VPRLYQEISNIKWDYDSPRVAGCTGSTCLWMLTVLDIDVMDPKNPKSVIDVRTFEYDASKQNQVLIDRTSRII